MANTLRFKRGLLAGLPSAAVGEPLFTTDTFDLYIGTASGTQKYQKFIASGTTSQLLRGDGSLLTMPIVLSSPANGEVLKYNGTNWVNSSDAGITGSGVAGQVAYFTGATTQGGSNNLFWDASNSRLGIGTNLPAATLEVSRSLAGGGLSTILANPTFAIRNPANWGYPVGIVFRTPMQDGGAVTNIGSVWCEWQSDNNSYLGFATNTSGTVSEKMRLNASGRLLLGSITDNGQRLQVTGDTLLRGSGNTSATTALRVQNSDTLQLFQILNNGNVGIGDASSAGYTLNVGKNITGSVISAGIWQNGSVLADVTTNAIGIYNFLRIPASTAISSYQHFRAESAAFGAGGTLGTQVGFIAENSLTTATNNYGFYGNIPSGTGRWNLYMNGTAANYLAGVTQIGSGALTSEQLQVNGTMRVSGILTAKSQVYVDDFVYVLKNTASNYYIATNGIDCDLSIYLTASTDAVKFASIQPSVIGRALTLNRSNGGNVLIGTSTDVGFKLDVNGTMRVSGASTFNADMTLSKSTLAQFNVTDTSNTTSSESYFKANAGTTQSFFGSYGQSRTPFKIIGSGDMYLYRFPTAGDIAILNDQSTGSIKMAAGGSSTAHFTIASTGAATFSNFITVTRNQDANVTTFNATAGVTPVSAFVINTDQPNLRSILMSRNGYSLVLGTQDVNRVTIDTTGAATFSSSVTANDVLTASSTGGGTSAIFRNLGAQNSNGIELRGGTAGTSVNWKIEKDNTVANAFQITPSTTNGGTTYTTPSLTILNTGAATFSSTISSTGTNGFAIGNLTNTQRIQYGSDVATSFTLLTAANAYAGLYAGAVVLSGNLTVDTNTLFVDSSANRVGVGTASPLYALHVTGDGYFGDNVRFPNLKGCVFVQTGGTLLGSIAMDSANAVTIDNNGFAGLSVGGSYTMTGGNLGIGHSAFGTSATKTISVNSGTAPSTSPADAFQLYSADITAGNAAPHFRTENGGIIKLYQQTTAVTSATYIGGAGTTVTDLDTFDGYTIPQIVKALRNAGLLA